MPAHSAPRAQRASLNSRRRPPAGTALLTHSTQSRRCATQRDILASCATSFGNLGLAAAAYNAGPGRVTAWLTSHRQLPGETRSYVAAVTGRTADEWSSSSPPTDAEVSILKAIPCTRLANLILPPKQEEAQHIEAHIPRWGIWVAAHLTESKALGDVPRQTEVACSRDR
jgi:hypothetical protein